MGKRGPKKGQGGRPRKDAGKAPQKRKTGRPCKLNDDVQKRICDALMVGLTMETAAKYGGITYSCLNNWMKHGEDDGKGIFFDFLNAVKNAVAQSEMSLVANIRAHGKKNWQASAWLCERRWPDRWARPQRHEISGPEGKPIEINQKIDYAELSDEQLHAIIAEDES